jgi:hypothetical protein
MKQNKLLTLSLLASFLLLISASYSTAANTLTFGTVNACPQKAGAKVYVPVDIGNEVDLSAFDVVGQIVSLSGGVNLKVTGVTFGGRMTLSNVLDQRYPIGDLGSGLFRFGAVKVSGADLAVGTGQVATLEMEFLSDCKLGSAGIDPATTNCNGSDKSTIFVDKNANLITPTITSGAVNVVNTAPTITNCPSTPFSVYWGVGSVVINFTATDPDLNCLCDALSWSKVSGPGNMVGSVYQFVATGADVGCNTVVVSVQDLFGGTATCTFQINVLNKPPVIDNCPSAELLYYVVGDTVMYDFDATDPDTGPGAKTFTIISYTLPTLYSTPSIDASTGVFIWSTIDDPYYAGTWSVCVKVTDNAKLDQCNTQNADTCCFTFRVDPKIRVMIDKAEGDSTTNFKGVLQGHYTDISIKLDSSYESVLMGGFDFLIAYDQTALTLTDAKPGDLLAYCHWEYFTYRFGPFGNCGNACPSGLVRIVAMAEINNGPYHPSCYNNASGKHELAKLTFLVTNDRTFECMFAPIRFYWLDCGDNTISSKYGDTLWIVSRVFEFEGFEGPAHEITDHVAPPSFTGIYDDCLDGDKVEPVRLIDFRDGGVDIVCGHDIDARGDINANGLGYEIADAVMFTNYFISGLNAFGTHAEASIAASDANADGVALSVADLVYLIRVVVGDARPYPKPISGSESITLNTQVLDNQMTVRYDASTDAGAALLIFTVDGTIGQPVVNVPGMEAVYGLNGSELRVLVYNIGKNKIPAGANSLVTIPVTGSLTLTEAEVADYYGNTMTVATHVLPSKFELAQNRPNPFNPSTTIELALPIASEYTVAIYNIEGQLVRAYSGSAAAGLVQVVWDGKDTAGNQVASGIYLYKALASDFSATKKMVLMK